MPATASYRLGRRNVNASVQGLLLRCKSQEVCFFPLPSLFQTVSLVFGYNTDSIEFAKS